MTADGGHEERGLSRAAKAALLGAALLGLLAIVALGARGGHPGGHGRLSQRSVPGRISDDLLTLVIVVYVLGVVGLAWAFMLSRRKWEPPHRHWIRDLFVTLAALSVVTLIGYHLIHSRLVHRKAQEQAQKQRQGGGAGAGRSSALKLRRVTSGGAHFDWTLASGLIGLLIVGSAIYYVRNRRPLPTLLEVDEDALAAELSAALSDAIDDLERESDSRRAVIAAYARMEGVLARRGLARRAAEAPFEYLARILEELNVREGAARELTELFEHAKFSTHQIDVEMKNRAIASFIAVRDDLHVPAAA